MRLFASGRAGLDAGPARRGARQSGSRVREDAAQRRLDGRSTSSLAGTSGSFRSKFDGQLSEIRLGDLRLALLKPETYMNVSGQVDRGRAAVLQGGAGFAPDRARRRRPRARAPAGAGRRRARRPQRPALDRGRARDAGLPAAPHRRRPSRPGRPAAGRRLRAVRVRAGAGRRCADRPRRGRRRDDRASKASSRRSSASIDPKPARSQSHRSSHPENPVGGWGLGMGPPRVLRSTARG